MNEGRNTYYRIQKALDEQLAPYKYELVRVEEPDSSKDFAQQTLWKNAKERYAVRLTWASDGQSFIIEESSYLHSVEPDSWTEIGRVDFEPEKAAEGYENETVQAALNLILKNPPKPKKAFVSRAKLTNRLLTDLVLRYGGLMMFMKIFDQADTFLQSSYFLLFSARMADMMDMEIQKFFSQEIILMALNIALSLFLIFKAEVISKRLVRHEIEIEWKLTVKALANLILVTTGVFWLCYSLFFIADLVGYSVKYAGGLIEEEMFDFKRFDFLRNIVRVAVAIWFITRSDKISAFIERRIGNRQSI